MALNPLLLELIVCPQDHQPLLYSSEDDLLINLRLKVAYKVRNDIPVLMVDDVVKLSSTDLDKYSELARNNLLVTTGGPLR